MEDHHFDHQILLSMHISCCEKCPVTLKRKLLEMPGVESVTIVIEKDLVIVTGTVEPMSLCNRVSRLGKRVVLLPNNGERRHQESQNCGALPHVDEGEEPQPRPHRCEPYNPPLRDEVERASRAFFGSLHQRSNPMAGDCSFVGDFDLPPGGCHRQRPFSFNFISTPRLPFW